MQEKNPSAFANTESTQTPAQKHSPTRVLFRHEPHQHQPRNVNLLMEAEQATAGFNARLAVALTKYTGTMWTAYVFAGIGIGSLVGVFTNNVFLGLLFGSISSYFLQLVLLPIIMTGQNVLGRKAELQADEAFNTTMSTYHDIEQIMQHLLAQDAELLHHTKMLIHLLEKNGISLQQLESEGASTSLLDSYVQPPSAGGAPAAPASPAGEKPNA